MCLVDSPNDTFVWYAYTCSSLPVVLVFKPLLEITSLNRRNMRHYYILNQHPSIIDVLTWIEASNIQYEVHLNRTRFWVPNDRLLTEFLLRFSECCSLVNDIELG